MPPKRAAAQEPAKPAKKAKVAKDATAAAAGSSVGATTAKKTAAEKANTGKKRATTAKKPAEKKAATTTTKTTTSKRTAAPKKAAAIKKSTTTMNGTATAPATKSTKRKAEESEEEPKAKKTKAEPKPKAAPKPKKEKVVRPPAPKTIINKVPTERLSIYTFGEGSAGELGQGSKGKDMNIKRPRLIKNMAPVIDISCGGMHTIALTADNKILTWGVNDQGALGRDTTWSGGLRDMDADDSDSDEEPDADKLNPREATPTAVPAEAFPAGTTFVQVAAGDSSSFALTDDGLVFGWGTFRSNEGIFGFTQEGYNDRKLIQSTPVLIASLKKITSIACGANHALALDANGKIFAWGSGQQMQLGRRINERHQAAGLDPTTVAIARQKVKFISSGEYHSFAIDEKDNVWAWGLNSFGETGIPEGAGGDAAIIVKPTKAPNLSGRGMQMIAGGSHHSAGIAKDGQILTWGRMDGGQLGIATNTLPVDDEDFVKKDITGRPRIMLQPAQVPGKSHSQLTLNTDANEKTGLKGSFVACGPEHCIAIAEGKAYSWGFNANYQLAQGHADDVQQATVIDNTAVRDVKLIWAGCGGQYGALGGPVVGS